MVQTNFYGKRKSRATDFGSGSAHAWDCTLWESRVSGYEFSGGLHSGSLESRATDFGSGTAHAWESTLWQSRVSGYRFSGRLHSGSLHPGSLEPRATDFGSGSAHALESTLWESRVSGYRFWIWKCTYLSLSGGDYSSSSTKTRFFKKMSRIF